jgi:hypothetical protein
MKSINYRYYFHDELTRCTAGDNLIEITVLYVQACFICLF